MYAHHPGNLSDDDRRPLTATRHNNAGDAHAPSSHLSAFDSTTSLDSWTELTKLERITTSGHTDHSATAHGQHSVPNNPLAHQLLPFLIRPARLEPHAPRSDRIGWLPAGAMATKSVIAPFSFRSGLCRSRSTRLLARRWLDLFYDLILVSVLAVFATIHPMATLFDIARFGTFYILLHWTWASQVRVSSRRSLPCVGPDLMTRLVPRFCTTSDFRART